MAHAASATAFATDDHRRRLNVQAVTAVQSGSTGFPGGPLGHAASRNVDTTPIWDMGIHGEGEIVGVMSTGLDSGHCFFENAAGETPADQVYSPSFRRGHRKIVSYRAHADGGATGQRDLGTHLVGTILGKSSTDSAPEAQERGVAYAARVAFTDVGPGDAPGLDVPTDLLGDMFRPDYALGARIFAIHDRCTAEDDPMTLPSDWCINSTNKYTTQAAMIDQASLELDELLVLVPAGDGGNPDRSPSITSLGTCKNCLTVGATENDQSQTQEGDGQLAVFSSTGLAVGGRIKPDVTAPGFFISSANSNADGDCAITEMAGTAHAMAFTAGAVALIRQYFREGWYPSGKRGTDFSGGKGPNSFKGGFIPSGALMKAMTIAAGQVMPGVFPQPGPGAQGAPQPQRLPQPVLGLRPCAAQPGAIWRGKRQDRGRQAVRNRRRVRGHRRREGLHHPNARQR